ncbi:MAG: hypothetical protein Q8P18_19280 [Pseudomonadota bacterium]|nr:hypothetical protein [Pseudomonadota bacterium]
MYAFLAVLTFLLSAWAAPATEGAAAAPAEEVAPAEAGEGGEAEEPAVVYAKPERVKVGVYVNDIQSIDLKTHTYALDAYIWFRWRNPDVNPAATMEFINPAELWGHMLTPVYEEPEELESGELYQVVRIQGRFSRKMPLFNYPFDRQVLTMIFEDTTHEAADLVYEQDEAVTLNPQLVLPGYNVGVPALILEETGYPTNFGDTRLKEPSRYTRASLSVPVSRPVVAYGIKLFVPVFCVIMCAALMFLLAPNFVDSRVDVGITSLLTIVALQMTFNQDLPDVGYLMLMDKVYLCSYLFVIVGLAVVVRTTRMVGTALEGTAIGLHRRTLTVFLSAWVGGVGFMIMSAISEG